MTDMVERWRLDEANVRTGRYAKLTSDIYYQVSAVHISSGGAVVEIRRLIDEFFSGAAGGSAPARSALPSPQRGPGTPDDWPDYAVDHPAPVGHLVFPEPHADDALKPMPEVHFGSVDLYRSEGRVVWVR